MQSAAEDKFIIDAICHKLDSYQKDRYWKEGRFADHQRQQQLLVVGGAFAFVVAGENVA